MKTDIKNQFLIFIYFYPKKYGTCFRYQQQAQITGVTGHTGKQDQAVKFE